MKEVLQVGNTSFTLLLLYFLAYSSYIASDSFFYSKKLKSMDPVGTYNFHIDAYLTDFRGKATCP